MEVKTLLSPNSHKQVMACLWRCAEDAIGQVGTSPKAQIRLVHIIAIYLKSFLVAQIKANCHYFGIGLDAQTTRDNHKNLSVWIRFVLEGMPMTMALGVREYKSDSKGLRTWEMTKKMLTGSDLTDDDFFKSYAGTEYTYDATDSNPAVRIKMSNFAEKMQEVMTLGFALDDIKTMCVSGCSDGAPDVQGRFSGTHGQVRNFLLEEEKRKEGNFWSNID